MLRGQQPKPKKPHKSGSKQYLAKRTRRPSKPTDRHRDVVYDLPEGAAHYGGAEQEPGWWITPPRP
jgi:hypothetical protein